MLDIFDSLRAIRHLLYYHGLRRIEPAARLIDAAARDLADCLADMKRVSEVEGHRGRKNPISVGELLNGLPRRHSGSPAAYALFRLIELDYLGSEIRQEDIPTSDPTRDTNNGWVGLDLDYHEIFIETENQEERGPYYVTNDIRKHHRLVVWDKPALWRWRSSGTELPTTIWPRSQTWDFRDGQFAYLGSVHSLSGIPWRLLKVLADSGGSPVSLDSIRERLGTSTESDSTIRGYISELRQTLRRLLNLPTDYDPIPRVAKRAFQLKLPERT